MPTPTSKYRWSAKRLPLWTTLLGLVVLTYPATVTVLSFEWSGVDKRVKFGSLILWGFAALIVVVRGFKQEGRVGALTNEVERTRTAARSLAESVIYRCLLSPELPFPRKWELTAYIFNNETARLEPVWPARAEDPHWELKCFASGAGATGLAWDLEGVIIKTGTEVHDGTHGLSPDQQSLFERMNTVAAVPIWSETETKVGVLTAITADVDPYFEGAAARALLQQTASTLGTVLSRISLVALR